MLLAAIVVVGGGRFPAYLQPLQRAAVILPLQCAVTLHLRAAKQPGDLGAKLQEGGRETRQGAGRELRRRQCGQAYMQRAAPLLIHLVDTNLQGEKIRAGQEGAEAAPTMQFSPFHTSNNSSVFSSLALNTMP